MLLHNKVFVGNSCVVNIPKVKRKDFEILKVFTIKKCQIIQQTQSDMNISYTHMCDICVYICHTYNTWYPIELYIFKCFTLESKLNFKNIVKPILKVPSN